MLTFRVEAGVPPAADSGCWYDAASHSFLAIARDDRAIWAVVVNYLQLHVDSARQALYIDGYAPIGNWTRTTLPVPGTLSGIVKVDIPDGLPTGSGMRLSEPNEWPTYFDGASGWVRVGDGAPNATVVGLNSGNALEILDGALVALWLRPKNESPSGTPRQTQPGTEPWTP